MTRRRAGEAVSCEIVPLTDTDAADVAKLHQNAFAGSAAALMGTRYVEAFLTWFVASDTTIALTAKAADGTAVGFLVAAPTGYSRVMNRDLFGDAVTGLALHPWLVFDIQFLRRLAGRLGRLRGSESRRVEPDLPGPAMSLVGVGVSSRARGSAIGSRLVSVFENKAKALGMQAVRLSVYPSNRAARRLYEKQGWQAFGHQDPADDREAMFYYKLLHELA